MPEDFTIRGDPQEIRLANASEQFRQSDVKLWSVIALVCGSLAIISANVSALVPKGVLSELHQPRLGATSNVESLRVQLSTLRDDMAVLRRETSFLASRFDVQEQSGNDTTRRVGALELTLPRVLEGLPNTPSVDRASLTASVEANGTQTDVDGGSMVIRQTPLPILAEPATIQPLPAPLDVAAADMNVAPTTQPFAIALGAPIAAESALAQWSELNIKVGPLLIGLIPKLAGDAGEDRKRIVAGPIQNLSDAKVLCERLERVSIACQPTAFSGTEINLP